MQRLKDKKGYQLLRQGTLKSVGRFFLIVYIFDSAMAESLAGITVSKKVGNAVTRNRVKRRIRAFLRDYKPCVLTPNFFCNIIALQSSVDADWSGFCADLSKCLERIKCLWHEIY